MCSSVSLDNGISDTFVSRDGKINNLGLILRPVRFMDDILRMAENVVSSQNAIKLFKELVGKKSLELNLDKSNFMIIGNKKSSKKLMKQVKKTPITLCGDRMKEVKVTKYLGDYLAPSLEKSVHETVLRRKGLANHAIYEIRTIIEDSRAKTIGGLM